MTNVSTERSRQWDRWWVTILFTVASAVFSGGGAVMALRKDIEVNKEANRRQDTTMETLRLEIQGLRNDTTEKIHTLDTMQAIIREQLMAIRAAQERMDKNLEKLANGHAKELGIKP